MPGQYRLVFLNIGLVEKPRSEELFWDEEPCLPKSKEINSLRRKTWCHNTNSSFLHWWSENLEKNKDEGTNPKERR